MGSSSHKQSITTAVWRIATPVGAGAIHTIRFGKKTMVLASEGVDRSWKLRADHRSPRYTTRLSDLPVVR
ncbi:DUF4113 domain-containing protein [Roseovarius sp. Pro17]|uniref:DUF4113 domain-containing protein n=1 Tax=Roseovarius sp. Pro17 TaxID=3108175 RepID=UPI003A7F59B2